MMMRMMMMMENYYHDDFEIVNNCFVAGSTIMATATSRTRTTV